MTDEELLRAFEQATVSPFPHRLHLRVAWLYVRRDGAETAARTMEDGLRRIAACHGRPAAYHRTITRAWVRVVAAAARRFPVDDFDELVEAHPQLLDKRLLRHHYSPSQLGGGRTEWREPDRAPLPRA